jgi:methionyl-tRNA formyltransferase
MIPMSKTSKKVYIIATIKSWNEEAFSQLQKKRTDCEFHLITHKEELTAERINELEPRYIFFPHWSWIIPKEIHAAHECIVFHMTDLPYGRGGSPLQNLIVNGKTETVLSAIKVEDGLDTGPVYYKQKLNLEGTANEILRRASQMTFHLIERFIDEEPLATPQKGTPFEFKRRKPSQSNISSLKEIKKIHDHIRMLDGEGYPKAFLETEYYKIEFDKSTIEGETVIARARFKIKQEDENEHSSHSSTSR